MKILLQKLIYKIFMFMKKQEKFFLYHHYLQSGELNIGKHSYGIPNIESYKGSKQKVTIGKYCSISKGVTFITGGIHPKEWVSTYPFRIQWNQKNAYQDGMPTSKGDITVGNDVWIGTDVMIFSGVNIGNGAVVAARSVVTRDIPPYAIAAGIPAKVINYRFSSDIIDKMLSLKWWDWEEDKIKQTIPLLSSSKIEEFLKRYLPNKNSIIEEK